MSFRKYQHVERIGTIETEGITNGECYIFYKIDGTNGCVWLEDGEVKAGSRKRELSLDDDNAKFCAAIMENENIKAYLLKHPTHRLFGEWLVPHTLKTYRENAWRKFYIFDVCVDKDEDIMEYLHYDVYQPLLEEFELDYIPFLAKLTNPTVDRLMKCLEKTGDFLVDDGKGLGEGIVVKNYDFHNRYGNKVWGKIVRVEFKGKTRRVMTSMQNSCEEAIIEKYCTTAFIEKEFAKLVNDNDGWSTKYIPQLFGRIYHELISEEIWHILKTFKNPTINFKRLSKLVIQKVKIVKADVFY